MHRVIAKDIIIHYTALSKLCTTYLKKSIMGRGSGGPGGLTLLHSSKTDKTRSNQHLHNSAAQNANSKLNRGHQVPLYLTPLPSTLGPKQAKKINLFFSVSDPDPVGSVSFGQIQIRIYVDLTPPLPLGPKQAKKKSTFFLNFLISGIFEKRKFPIF